MSRVVLLTVPHATCPTSVARGGHPCDVLARTAAMRIQQHAPRVIGPPLVATDTPRSKCDLNRRRCRDYPWRQELRRRMAQGVAFVLDVHSYPPRRGEWGLYDVVLLDNTPRPEPFKSYTISLVQFLHGEGVSVAVGRGGANDIQNEARERGIPSVLMEVNERLASDSVALGVVARSTAQWLQARTSPLLSHSLGLDCHVCGEPAAWRCSRCKDAYYCGEGCQHKAVASGAYCCGE